MTYVVITGSLISGLELYGPFNSIDEAVEWIEQRPLIGFTTVMKVKSPNEY